MINEVDILHESHSRNFACHSGEKAAGLLCVVSYHHKVIIELREYGFDSFAESLVGPCRWTPLFLIHPIWYFKGDIGHLEEILLDLSAEISLVSKYHTIMINPAHVIKIVEVMDTCRCHVIRMDYTAYSTDCMELISIVVQTLRCAISPVGGSLYIIASHGASFRPCVLADLYRLGINAEYILRPINGNSYILADLFCKTCCQFTPRIELSAAYEIWQILLALMVQTMKEKIFAIESESLGGYTQSHDFKIGKLRDYTTTGYVSEFIYTIFSEILAYSEDSDEICYEVAHKQCDST